MFKTMCGFAWACLVLLVFVKAAAAGRPAHPAQLNNGK
jgi:hypothetical protein